MLICGKREYSKIAAKINPDGKPVRAFYPGCGPDLLSAVACTDAVEIIVLDPKNGGKLMDKARESLEENGGHWVMHSGRELRFEYNGKSRVAKFYPGRVEDLCAMPKEVAKGFDVYFEKNLPEILPRNVYTSLYSLVKVGGHVIQDTPLLGKLPPEKVGFELIETGIKKRFGLSGAGPLVYRKIKKVEILKLAALMAADCAAVYGL